MKRMPIFESRLITIIVFFVYPILSLPSLLYNMVRRKRWAFFLFAVFMGLVAILWPPYGDMYRYALDFENMKGMDWNSFQLFMLLRFDIFLPYLSFFLANHGGSFEIIRFLFNFFGYLIIFDVLHIVVNYNRLYDNHKLFVCALLLLVPFSLANYLFRSGLGAVILLDGGVRWFYLKQKRGLLFCLLSAIVHFSNVPFILLFLISKNRFFQFKYQTVIIILVLMPVMDAGGVAEWILSYLPFSDNLIVHIYEYIEGSQSEPITKKFSINQIIINIASNIVQYIWIIIYIILYKKFRGNLPMMSFVNLLLILLLLISSFPIMYDRYFIIAFTFMTVIVMLNLDLKILSCMNLKRLTYVKVFFLLLSYYQSNRYPLIYSYEYRLLSSSLPEIISTRYTENWIVNNLDKDGDFYVRVQKHGKGK